MPLHLRNAPTKLMKELGYGRGYRYAHDEAEGVSEMSSLPEHLQTRRYYEPTAREIRACEARRTAPAAPAKACSQQERVLGLCGG